MTRTNQLCDLNLTFPTLLCTGSWASLAHVFGLGRAAGGDGQFVLFGVAYGAGGRHLAVQTAFSSQEERQRLFKMVGFSPSARQAMA